MWHAVVYNTAGHAFIRGSSGYCGLGRRQAAAVTAPMGSFPDCVLWDVNRYCKKKKKDSKESCAMSWTGSWWARMLPKSADAKPGLYTRPSPSGSSGSGQGAEGLWL